MIQVTELSFRKNGNNSRAQTLPNKYFRNAALVDVKLFQPETLVLEKMFVGERRVLFSPLNLHYLIVLLLCSSVKYAYNESSDLTGTSKPRFKKKKISFHSICREIKN